MDHSFIHGHVWICQRTEKDREEGFRGGGGVRLDPQQIKVAIFKLFKLRWSFSTSLSIHNTFQPIVYAAERVKHANCKKVKGWDWSVQTQWRHRDFWHGSDRWSMVHPCWWRLQPMKGKGYASPRRAPPTKGPQRSNLVYPTLAIAHEGLASLG